MKTKFSIFLILFALIILSSCAKLESNPSDLVEKYLDALVNKDINTISSLVCADWEEQAIREVDSLLSVGSELKNVSCSQKNNDGTIAEIICQGKIILTYNTEVQEIDLSRRIYYLNHIDNNWLLCGYK